MSGGGYYLAPSLVSLRNEINEAHPTRDKSSDGWIGDPSHAARVSDHNPDWDSGGVVRALDVDHDGIDKHVLLHVAIADPRTEYVIQDWKIYRRATGFKAEQYRGSNGHTGHTHISLRHIKTAEKSGRWGYVVTIAAPVQPSPGGPSVPWGGGKSVDVVAQEVIRGEWGAGQDRVNRLRTAGYDVGLVQNTVNALLLGRPAPAAPAPPPPPRKSVSQIADEVIAGHWGNGPARSQRLQAAGFSPSAVQAEVNRRLGGGRGGAVVRPSLNTIARQVIAGQWGNGRERASRLTSAGYNAAAVQAEVNRILR